MTTTSRGRSTPWATGRQFSDDGAAQTRGVNAANEITSTSGIATPQYDRAGNMLSDGTRHYKYDAWNRLVEVRADDSGDPGDVIATYEYDGTNRRIEKAVTAEGGGPSHEHYFYNNQWQMLEERSVDGEGATISSNQYVWSPRYIDAPVVRYHDGNGDGDLLDAGDNVRYYSTDANHNVTATIDAASGDVVECYVYTAYGAALAYDADWDNFRRACQRRPALLRLLVRCRNWPQPGSQPVLQFRPGDVCQQGSNYL